jgi:hypothetical protein
MDGMDIKQLGRTLIQPIRGSPIAAARASARTPPSPAATSSAATHESSSAGSRSRR